jgi:hypothetical protein
MENNLLAKFKHIHKASEFHENRFNLKDSMLLVFAYDETSPTDEQQYWHDYLTDLKSLYPNHLDILLVKITLNLSSPKAPQT